MVGARPARKGMVTKAYGIWVETRSGVLAPPQTPVAVVVIVAVGTPVNLVVRGKRLPAQVAKMPFVPQRYHKN